MIRPVDNILECYSVQQFKEFFVIAAAQSNSIVRALIGKQHLLTIYTVQCVGGKYGTAF